MQHGVDLLTLLQATVGETQLLNAQFSNADWGQVSPS